MFRSFWENLTIKQKLAITAWLFLAIPIIFYITIRFYPTYEAFYVSFMKWNLLGAKKYIGFKNYIRIWGDEDFWIVLWNTIKYAIIGGSGIVVNMGSYYLLTRVTHLNYQWAVLIALELSIISNFIGHHFWTFNAKNQEEKSWHLRIFNYHLSVIASTLMRHCLPHFYILGS